MSALASTVVSGFRKARTRGISSSRAASVALVRLNGASLALSPANGPCTSVVLPSPSSTCWRWTFWFCHLIFRVRGLSAPAAVFSRRSRTRLCRKRVSALFESRIPVRASTGGGDGTGVTMLPTGWSPMMVAVHAPCAPGERAQAWRGEGRRAGARELLRADGDGSHAGHDRELVRRVEQRPDADVEQDPRHGQAFEAGVGAAEKLLEHRPAEINVGPEIIREVVLRAVAVRPTARGWRGAVVLFPVAVGGLDPVGVGFSLSGGLVGAAGIQEVGEPDRRPAGQLHGVRAVAPGIALPPPDVKAREVAVLPVQVRVGEVGVAPGDVDPVASRSSRPRRCWRAAAGGPGRAGRPRSRCTGCRLSGRPGRPG